MNRVQLQTATVSSTSPKTRPDRATPGHREVPLIANLDAGFSPSWDEVRTAWGEIEPRTVGRPQR